MTMTKTGYLPIFLSLTVGLQRFQNETHNGGFAHLTVTLQTTHSSPPIQLGRMKKNPRG
jgi:hypothetical protein